MRIVFTIITFVISYSSLGQLISFRDYFPLREGDKKVYRLYQVQKGKKILMQDSLVNICQFKVINNTPVYYFRRDVFPDDTLLAWGIPMFCYSFYFKESNLMTFPNMFKSQLDTATLNSFILDIPKVIHLKRVYKNWKKSMNQVYVFNRVETLKIGGHVLKNCLKLTAYTYDHHHKYKWEYWFKKDLGFVKYLEKGEIGTIWEIRI